MGDGKALQLGTSHELGQNFARAFDIPFSDESGALSSTSGRRRGARSTRLIGALIMVHGDDFGLRLPPALAPSQVVVMVVRADEATGGPRPAIAEDLKAAGLRVRLDDRTDTGFGRRAIDWERKGVPVRVEVGPRDLAEDKVTVVVRHDRTKAPVPLARPGRRGPGGARADRRDAVRRGPGLPGRADDDGGHPGRGDRGRDRAGSPVLPWAAVGEAGEDRLAEAGITVRCLQRPDGVSRRRPTTSPSSPSSGNPTDWYSVRRCPVLNGTLLKRGPRPTLSFCGRSAAAGQSPQGKGRRAAPERGGGSGRDRTARRRARHRSSQASGLELVDVGRRRVPRSR